MQEENSENKVLAPPANINLPFFAYGIFKHGEIGFIKLKPYVNEIKKNLGLQSKLYVKDGVPLINLNDIEATTYGDILFFKNSIDAEEAYKRIGELEPTEYYVWREIKIDNQSVNVLAGKNVNKGTNEVEDGYWDSWSDTLFTTMFELVDEVLKEPTNDITGKQFLKLQMTYLLLWVAIERYVTLRYKIGGNNVMQKIYNLVYENQFVLGVKALGDKERKIFKNYSSSKENFIADNPKKCLNYYYQIRSNIAHRGKAVFDDAKLVHCALSEMSGIFKKILEEAKKEAFY
jgi:hypothetical protein